MILSRLRDWLPGPAPSGHRMGAVVPTLFDDRMAVSDALWGAGFNVPGGEEEVRRLAAPLGLSGACSMLLLGCGAGGAPCWLAQAFGAWVSGFESDPALLAAATRRCTAAGLGRRAWIEPWDTAAPRFPARYYHHALALEPLRHAAPAVVLPALAGALRPRGNLAMTEMVIDDTASRDLALGDWLQAERREMPPAASAVTGALEGLGFDVRVAQDITQRHLRLILRGWGDLLDGIGTTRPTPARAAHLVAEAEIWLLRARLMRAGHVRLMRWHAIGPGTVC